jgi:hypothetical protein
MEAALTTTPAPQNAPLGMIEKTRLLSAVGLAGVLLYVLGWMIAAPSDPHLPLTFVYSGRAAVAIWPALAIVAVVAGVVGTVVSGPRLPDAGLFAGCVGLAVLSLHGGSMQDLLEAQAANTTAARQAMMLALGLDTLLWSAVLIAMWIAVLWTYHWVWGGASPAPAAKAGAPVGFARSGWAAMAATVVVALFTIWMTAGREPVANVQRGQTIAAVAGGLYLGAMAARYFTGVERSAWYIMSVPVVGLVAWLVGYMSADMSWAQAGKYQYYVYLATTPVHDLARPLPLEYIAVGTAAVLAGFWGGDKMEEAAANVTP